MSPDPRTVLKVAIVLSCTTLLGGCRASPLYIGQWGKDQPTAPGAVPRDGRGEPIMDNLPPLGAPLPAAASPKPGV